MEQRVYRTGDVEEQLLPEIAVARAKRAARQQDWNSVLVLAQAALALESENVEAEALRALAFKKLPNAAPAAIPAGRTGRRIKRDERELVEEVTKLLHALDETRSNNENGRAH